MSTGIPLNENEKEAAKIFANARGFQTVAALLDRQTGPVRSLVHFQMIANEVFALELSIKALLKLRGKNARGHNIRKLYGSLDKKDKASITTHFDKLIKEHPQYDAAVKDSLPLDIASVLLRNRDTFIRARYWHEEINPLADDQDNVSNAGTGTLSEAIKWVIVGEYQLWQDENLARAIKPQGKVGPAT
jgi:HEPN domain-containing protein